MYDTKAEATKASHRATNRTRRAARYAQDAADAYKAASRWAANLRMFPDSRLAADYETNARIFASVGDTWLRMSFRETEAAAEDRARAARLRAMAATS